MELLIGKLPYGDFDCEINSIIYYMAKAELALDPIFRYNWDFYYDAEEDLIRGTVPLANITAYLNRSYNIQLETVALENCQVGDKLIIPVNAYWVSYAADYHLKNRLVHYFPATLTSESVLQAADVIFRYMGPVTKQMIQDAARGIDRAILRYNDNGSTHVAEPRPMPFLAGEQVRERYELTFDYIRNEIVKFVADESNLHHDYRYKKWFGALQSILLARERYLSSNSNTLEAGIQSCITHEWRKVTKGFMKLSFDRKSGYSQTMNSFRQAVELEINYLEGLQHTRKGG